MIHVRRERPDDAEPVRAVYRRAFETDAEAGIVDRLRDSCESYLAFVAVDGQTVVGHILFTPVTLDGSALVGMGLAPMAVDPSVQNRGVGTLLVRQGLEHLRGAGCPFVVVLGHPEYYPRFGFEPASTRRVTCQWDGVPDEAFMIQVFDRGAFPAGGGIARYRPEFDEAT
jgi:putative acetyltransferase